MAGDTCRVTLRAIPSADPPEGTAEAEKASKTSDSAGLRLVLGVTSIASLLTGLAALALGLEGLRAVALMTFLFLGVGAAPWQLDSRLRTYERLVLMFVTSMVAMILIPMAMMRLDFWQPAAVFAAVAAVCLPLHVMGVLAVVREAGRSGSVRRPSGYLPNASVGRRIVESLIEGLPATAIATTGAALCLVTAQRYQHLAPDFYGFPRDIGPLWYVGIALVLVGVALNRRPEHSRAIPVVLLVLCLTLTPALTYGGPRSQSAAKHVDFVLQIQSLHELTTSVPIYNAYAGFFAAMAWLCEVTGISDPMVLATFWPALLGLFRVVVLRYLAGQVLPRSDQCWVAVTLAVLADSIGADYFSPQSVGFTLGLAVFGIALSKSSQVPRLLLILLLGLTLAVTHQLSPYVVSGVLVVLVAFRLVRPWWTPVLILGPAVAWALLNWGSVNDFLSLESFLEVGNFRPPKTDAAPTLERLPVVRATVVALLAGVVLVGGLATITLVRNLRRAQYWALACSAGVGLVLIAVNPYGQEGIFRAVLFGLPWLAILAAPALGTRMPFRPAVLVTTAVLLSTFLVSSFGLDAANVVRSSDVDAIRLFREQGGPRPPDPYHLMLLNPGDHPTSPDVKGGKHIIWDRDDLEYPVYEKQDFSGPAEVETLTNRLLDYSQAAENNSQLFALWSPVGQRYGEAYGIQTSAQSAALRDAFLQSPYWTVEREDQGTYLFRLALSRYERTES